MATRCSEASTRQAEADILRAVVEERIDDQVVGSRSRPALGGGRLAPGDEQAICQTARITMMTMAGGSSAVADFLTISAALETAFRAWPGRRSRLAGLAGPANAALSLDCLDGHVLANLRRKNRRFGGAAMRGRLAGQADALIARLSR